ncbi:tetratricopeptide repeat protein [Bordetella sp.]|uniref:tetratricopeptide repeat protein n=1 Tax=Bordetella sp. TaxID=28081 RepID=UPI0039C8A49F
MQPLSVHAQPASDPAAAKHPAPAAPPIAGRSIQLREGKLPLVPLTGDIFYRVVASEIAAQRGMFGPAANTLIPLARETGDPRLAHRALEFQLAGGNLAGALDAAHLWAQLAPYDSNASAAELALSAANGQTRGMAAALRKRIQEAADKPTAINQAMGVVSRLNDRRLALRIMDEALSDPAVRKLPAASLALSDAAHAAGNDARAVSEARTALAADPKSEPAALRALEYGIAVDPVVAQRQARDFLARNPNARRLHLVLVGQMVKDGKYDEALAELDAMSRRTPEDFDLLYMQAQVAYRAGRLDPARALLGQYLDVQEQRQRSTAPGATMASASASDAHVLLARIDEDQGRIDDAITELGRIQDPAMRYDAQLRQAVLIARQGHTDKALALLDNTAAQDDDERVQGYLTRSQIQRDANRMDAAIATLKTADRAFPDTPEIKYELAMLNERLGRISEVERLLRQVIALNPDNAQAYNALGYTLADHNKSLPEALDLITQALNIAPNDPFILDSMGWVRFRMGQLDRAAEYLRRAYAQRPEADICAHYAEVLWKKGDHERATALLREGYKKDPKNPTVIDTLKRLGVKP